jgi:hypothetical protein
LECGSAIISGANIDSIMENIEQVTNNNFEWNSPEGYLDLNVSHKAIKIITSFHNKV